MPQWLLILSWTCLPVACVCAAIIAIDLLGGHRQHMWIMNVVWPITALYAGRWRCVFWFMMQIVMLCGFGTSYPVNWWLLRSGIKEKM